MLLVPKVYVESDQHVLVKVFEDIGWEGTTALADADVVVLMGGADISPQWYGQKKHYLCNSFYEAMDNRTAYLIKHAFQYEKPLIGICRGAQMINAVVGGSMYQHVDGHNQNHMIVDKVTDNRYLVNSIHHQMMIPNSSLAEIVAVAENTDMTERHYMDGDTPVTLYGKSEPEVEVIWYKHVQALCYQAHPEYAPLMSDTRQYFYRLLARYYPHLGNSWRKQK